MWIGMALGKVGFVIKNATLGAICGPATAWYNMGAADNADDTGPRVVVAIMVGPGIGVLNAIKHRNDPFYSPMDDLRKARREDHERHAR